MKIFEVFNQKVLPDDGLLRAVCDTCRYTIETSWKRNYNWEVTDSKKKWYSFVMAAVEEIKLFSNPSVNVRKHLSFPQCSRVFVQILIR